MRKFLKRTAMVFMAGFMSLMFIGMLNAQEIKKININTATVQELTQLHKVGDKIAERIIEYRTTVAPFKKPEDIMNVKGIGASIFEMNKDRIIVEEEKPLEPKEKTGQ